MKKEAQFTTKFLKWARQNLSTCAIEIKHTRGENVFKVSELKEHQYLSLKAVTHTAGITPAFAYKIPDDAVSYKPFDVVMFKAQPAYVVICYPKEFCVISVLKFPIKIKHLTNERARNIALHTVPLSDLH